MQFHCNQISGIVYLSGTLSPLSPTRKSEAFQNVVGKGVMKLDIKKTVADSERRYHGSRICPLGAVNQNYAW